MPHHIKAAIRHPATPERVSVEAPAVPVEPSVPEPVVEPKPLVKWDAKMRKADLLAIAHSLGLQVQESDTKAVIVAALETATTG